MKTFATFVVCAMLASAASAGIDLPKSRIGFTFTQVSVPVEGTFKRFTANVVFNAAKPENSRAEIVIDLDSIDTGSAEADTEARRKPWFHTAEHPKATFRSTAIRATGKDRYEITGKLTLKGRTHPVSAGVQLSRVGATTVYEGALAIKRLDFAIGEGPWADTDTVANEVNIRFRLVEAAP